MRKTWQFLPQSFVTSAIKKMGRDKILQFIEQCNVSVKEAVERNEGDKALSCEYVTTVQ